MAHLPPHETFHLLRGRVQIAQGKEGLRAGSDAVLLGATPLSAARVLELGCGVGQALLCYGWRNPAAELIGIECQRDNARLAEVNFHNNFHKSGFAECGRVVCGDFSDSALMHAAGVMSDSYDLVLFNPPFYHPEAHTPPKDRARQQSHIEETALVDWIAHALRYARQFAWIALIHRPERLGEILVCLEGKAGDIRLLPIASRVGQEAKRVMIFARKSRRASLRLLSPLVMHDADGHSAAARRIFEDAEVLPLSLD